jgi:hypothetical protein
VANPNSILGSLNRLVSSLSWPSNPALNVTAPYLGRAGIRFSRAGGATAMLPQMTGVVLSPEPFMLITVSVALLKTQGLCQSYENQLLTNCQLGNGVVRADVTQGLQPIDIVNCAIENIGDLSFAGDDAVYPVSIQGTLYINNQLWP